MGNSGSTSCHIEILGCDEKDMCGEFVMKAPQFSYWKWIILTMLSNIVAYSFNLHTQAPEVLFAVLILVLTVFIIKINFRVSKESLLVISSLGVQITTTFMSGRRKSQFYSQNEIIDIVINEAVTMQKVIFCLCLLLKCASANQEMKVVPLFTHSWPKLCCLQKICNGIWPLRKHLLDLNHVQGN